MTVKIVLRIDVLVLLQMSRRLHPFTIHRCLAGDGFHPPPPKLLAEIWGKFSHTVCLTETHRKLVCPV